MSKENSISLAFKETVLTEEEAKCFDEILGRKSTIREQCFERGIDTSKHAIQEIAREAE